MEEKGDKTESVQNPCGDGLHKLPAKRYAGAGQGSIERAMRELGKVPFSPDTTSGGGSPQREIGN